jgi:hypothetical protein
MTNPNSPVTALVENTVIPAVYAWYKTVNGNLCSNTIGAKMCTFNNLTYAQWDSCAVLFDPMPSMGAIDVMDLSYVVHYRRWTLLTYPPEAWYYGARSTNQLPAEVGIAQVYQGLQIDGLYT